MITLSQKLRQIRSWQGLTLAQFCLRGTLSMKHMVAIESEGRRWKGDTLGDALTGQLAHAYGIEAETMKRWLDDEWTWRMCARDGNPDTLPRMSQYIYRPLPEAAHNLFKHGFVVLDCETTGKDPHAETEMCEITILDTDGVVLVNSLIKPAQAISDKLSAIHGISNEMVAEAPTFREIFPEIARAISGQMVVIYNANYDAWLLDRLIIEHCLDMPDFEPWCLLRAYADHFKASGQYGNYAWQTLSAACEQQGIEWDSEAHRSLADTTMTWRLLQKLALQYERKPS